MFFFNKAQVWCLSMMLLLRFVSYSNELFYGAGIAPDSKYAIENGDFTNGGNGLQQEQKAVKEALIKAYDYNIATKLKAELCTVDPNNYGYTREMASASKPL